MQVFPLGFPPEELVETSDGLSVHAYVRVRHLNDGFFICSNGEKLFEIVFSSNSTVLSRS